MVGDAAQDVGESSLWLVAFEFCRGGQGVDRCCPFGKSCGRRVSGHLATTVHGPGQHCQMSELDPENRTAG